MRIVACPDKFKGTASAAEVADAICSAARAAGHECSAVPMADGGEGTLAALGGANRTSTVTGPLGELVEAAWRLDGRTAVIEMAEAAGLVLAGGSAGNDPLDATTRGVGELIREAVEAGATNITVGVGGSATTDGGLGALDAIGSPTKLAGIDLVVACDVRTRFVDAAEVFAPQKGASAAQVGLLKRRLELLGDEYEQRYGIAVTDVPRSGAAGGLAGGLAAFGAQLVDGFDVVSEKLDLSRTIEASELVITGEGFLDAESFDGKVVGGVVKLARQSIVPVIAIAGQVFDGVDMKLGTISLAEMYGLDRAMTEPLVCIAEAMVSVVESA